MSRAKKSDFKVTLVRNSSQCLSRIQPVVPSNVPSSSSNINCTSSSRIDRIPQTNSEFNLPEMHSALKLSKKIDEVVKIDRKKLTSHHRLRSEELDERALKNLNMPYNKPLFKNLISLEVNPKDFEINYYKARITPRPRVKPHSCIKLDSSSDTSSELSTPKVLLDIPKDVLGYVEEKELYDPSSRKFKLYKVLKIDDVADKVSFSAAKSSDKVFMDLPKDILGFVEEKELYDPSNRTFKHFRVLKIDEAYNSSERVTFDAKSAESTHFRTKFNGSEASVECNTTRSYRNANYVPSESDFRFRTLSTDSRESPTLYREFS